MTNELEKKFFDTFGIKQREYTQCCRLGCKKPHTDCLNCQYHEVYKIDYPKITDRILLELICIANKYYIDLEGTDIETMKNSLLENFIFFKRDVKEGVRTYLRRCNNDR